MWSKLIAVALAAVSSLSLPNTYNKSSVDAENVIYWTPRTKLIGSDFKRKPIEESHFSAGSHLGTGLEIEGTQLNFKLTVRAYFVPDKSWIKVHDADLLRHEQTHFDIEEYYARLIRKKLKGLRTKGRSFEQVRDEADVIFNDLLAERELFQEQFDAESGHSVNVEKEREWEEKVRLGLQETQAYASPDIMFSLL